MIYLDCDDVLADFNEFARAMFGMTPRDAEATHGSDYVWQRIFDYGTFYLDLPVLPEGRLVYESVKHLSPTILTGVHSGSHYDEDCRQKVAWAELYFPGVPVITCESKNKCHYAKPGDFLVDDYLKYRHLWEQVGGIFVHFQNNAYLTIEELRQHGLEL
jgi:hypothetical protein